MADSSALCCVPSLHAFPRCSRERESAFARLHWAPFFSSSPRMSPIRGVPAARRVGCRASGSDDAGVFGGDDVYGFYPWDPRNASAGGDAIRWMPEDRITLFTADGLIQIGGSLVPRQTSSNKNQAKSKFPQKVQRFQESDYMDPNQGLCLGALFDIAATNTLYFWILPFHRNAK